MEVKLAEALLRRKELQEKVDQVRKVKENTIYDTNIRRVNVAEGIDEATINSCKLTLKEVTKEYDFYAKHLRLIDAAIQQANWTTAIQVDDLAMKNFEEDKVETSEK